jgi:hypothetical protein
MASSVFAITEVYVAAIFGCSMAVPVGAWAVGLIVCEGVICSAGKVEQAPATSIAIIANATFNKRPLCRMLERTFLIVLSR